MVQFRFSDLSHDNLKTIVKLHEQGIMPDVWEHLKASLTIQEQERLQVLQSYLLNYPLSLMNEATIWSRAIYPMLLLAEKGRIQAWAQVPFSAQYARFALEGTVDGVLGDAVSGIVDSPYLVVVEAKRGLEATNPQFQLYGEMLAAAWRNWRQNQEAPQEIFGCYTISDTWTFVQGVVQEFEAEYPVMAIVSSREYVEKLEAETVLCLLKGIVAKHTN